MVKYYCNKCGTEIKQKMLRVVTVDTQDKKQTYHLCFNCTGKFMEFLKCDEQAVRKDNVQDSIVTSGYIEPVKTDVSTDVVTESMSTVEPVIEKAKESKTESDNADNSQDTDIRGGRSKYMTEENKRYINLHKSEMSASQIAKELSIPYASVYQYLKLCKRHGEIDAGPTEDLSKEDVGKVLALRRAGWAVKDIAGELSREEHTIRIAIAKYGDSL